VIVTCHQCATQFHLDDAKVPPDGIRVRCSRCKFAFMVDSPEQPAVDHGESVAAAALAPPGTSADDGEGGESDWEFNEDIAAGPPGESDSDGRDAAAAAVDDLLGAVGSRGTAGDAPAGGSTDPEPVSGGFASGLGESTSSLSQSASGLEESSLGSAYEIDTESVDTDLGGSDFDAAEPVSFDEVDLGAEIDSRPSDDVHADLSIDAESPLAGSDDRSDDEAVVDPAPAEAAEAIVAAPFDGIASEAAPGADGEAESLASGEVADDDEALETSSEQPPWSAEAPVDLDDEAVATPRWAAVARAATGWTVVTALCLTALALGLFPAVPAASPEVSPRAIAGLEAHGVEGKWIDNSVTGPIYVISGTLRPGSASPTTGVELRVRLIDGGGDPVSSESAAIGPAIPTRQLREANPLDLRQQQERGARRFAAGRLAAAERRPFHALFERVPPAAAAFEIYAVEASSAAPAEIPFSDLTPEMTSAP